MDSLLKCAVVAMARTGATRYSVSKIYELLALAGHDETKVTYHGEYLNSNIDKTKNEDLLREIFLSSNSFIVKLFPTDFPDSTVENVNWNLLDNIYFIHRQNLTNQLLSFLVASATNQWIKHIEKPWDDFNSYITVTDFDIANFVQMLQHRDYVESKIKQQVLASKIFTIDYETIVTIPTKAKRIQPTNYDYASICTNYAYVEERLTTLYLKDKT